MAGNIETLIGKNCEVEGGITAKGTVRIDGKVEGDVVSDDGVITGEHSFIKGDITCKFAVIGGRVNGDVTASKKLEILNTGKVYGDIRSPKLMMAEGVVFQGTCEMEKGDEKK